MDSVQHCQDQSAECLRLIKLAQSESEAQVLKNLSMTWSRLAGQLDRYNALIREQGRRAVGK
jgi:hypothetical protein